MKETLTSKDIEIRAFKKKISSQNDKIEELIESLCDFEDNKQQLRATKSKLELREQEVRDLKCENDRLQERVINLES